MIDERAPRRDPVPPAIEARGLMAGYHGHPVVHGVDLRVGSGEVVALLGANGAGKTTTLLALCGEIAPIAGDVLVAGTPTSAPLHRRANQDLAFVAQERSVVMGLSTRDNLRLAHVDVEPVLELFPELERCLDRRVGLLSGGEQQMLSLGRALARRRPLLVADEMSLGLAPIIVTRLLEAVRRAATANGTAVLIVEQHARKALRYVDHGYVLRNGRVALAGTATELSDRITDIEETYLTTAIVSRDYDDHSTGDR